MADEIMGLDRLEGVSIDRPMPLVLFGPACDLSRAFGEERLLEWGDLRIYMIVIVYPDQRLGAYTAGRTAEWAVEMIQEANAMPGLGGNGRYDFIASPVIEATLASVIDGASEG